MGAMGKKISSFLLTKFTGSYLEIFINNVIKMWEQFRIIEFAFIISLIGQIFLMSSSDIVSMLSTTAGGLAYFFIDPFWLAAMVPIKIYSNADTDKAPILKENKQKSGIYLWRNLINNKQYIGSSINLTNRFRCYYNELDMKKTLEKGKSNIYSALLKHGHSNFSLTILEYCSPEQCIEREDFYLSCLPHEYNILKKAGSWLGHKHSDKTLTIMSDAKKGENNPMYGKTGENHHNYGQPRPEGAGRPSQQIEVTDIANNITTSYDSIHEAARALNIHQTVIDKYFYRNQKKPYKGKYTFKKL